MSVTISQFGKTNLGKDIKLYTIKNSKGMEAAATNLGACLVNLIVPNDKGESKDVILGFGSGEEYLVNGSFFGATVGRVANRTANAKFSIDGTEYKLAVNDNENNLHSDFYKGMHKVLWDAETGDDHVKFSYHSPDMENGFPGNFDISVTYTLTEENEIVISYDGVSDKKTLINMTNHTYFNLSGHDSGSIENTQLQIFASCYTPVVKGAIPTGEIAKVAGTVMDFTKSKTIGQDIRSGFEQLTLVQGYDHNYVVDDYDGKSKLIAIAKADGRTMKVFSDLPGVQFYAGNCIAAQEGKGGASYKARDGFCLETQYFPNSANDPAFLHPIFDAGQKYETTTIYRFE
ncbi:MAG: galactose mutarotase [Lachnospiraceae bacterium]|nr:galactose mutarotase [Lachnospiraceae bacterium]